MLEKLIPRCQTLYSKDEKLETERFAKCAAFTSITLSVAALAASVVVAPMFYDYVLFAQSRVDSEIAFCQSKTKQLWSDVVTIIRENPVQWSAIEPRASRQKAARSAAYSRSPLKYAQLTRHTFDVVWAPQPLAPILDDATNVEFDPYGEQVDKSTEATTVVSDEAIKTALQLQISAQKCK